MPDNLIRNDVTVFTTGPDCFKCTLTKNALTRGGVEYREVRLDKDPEALALVKSKGFQSAPVVHVSDGDKWWDDFRVDKLRALIAGVKK
ncbi:NrdH [Mycobacterium phage Euphoria]|uniref:NrdH n=1 Tax=Mycobacterium phage Euphoria TaxID=2922223 RepID=G1EVB2_9CAUD|nr:NrdH [Mycobacterium phage Euphoria]AEJ93733.1 NrdH [Mycobacterium phage Euphoria]